MLQESCLLQDFDFFKYQTCVAESKLVNSCNARASACRLSYPSRSFGDGIFFLYILLPLFCLLGWLLIFLFSSMYFREPFLIMAEEDKDLQKTVRRRAKKLRQEMLQRKATLMERARAYLALALFFFDLASDGSCLVQFLVTGQPGFAAAQAGIVLVAAATEFWKGSPRELLEAFTDFRMTGVPPDKFLSIIQAEQGLEAPLSFLLQNYSAFFTSGSEFAFLNLCFSIAMSQHPSRHGGCLRCSRVARPRLRLGTSNASCAASARGDGFAARHGAAAPNLGHAVAAPARHGGDRPIAAPARHVARHGCGSHAATAPRGAHPAWGTSQGHGVRRFTIDLWGYGWQVSHGFTMFHRNLRGHPECQNFEEPRAQGVCKS